MKNFLKSSSVLYLINEVSSAGMTSHNIAALRASQFEYFGPETTLFQSNNFYGLAKDRYDAIQAGSPFPDYLYACGTEHDAGNYIFNLFLHFFSSFIAFFLSFFVLFI